MGTKTFSTSAELHREAEAASGPAAPPVGPMHMAEIVNPKATLARREDEAGLSNAMSPPAPAPVATTGTMSQSDFSKGDVKPRGVPPAEMLRRHRDN